MNLERMCSGVGHIPELWVGSICMLCKMNNIGLLLCH